MRRLLSACLIALTLAAAGLYADDRFEQIVVAGTAIGFTAAKIDPAGQPQGQIASCRARTAEMSVTYDGTTPTASVGILLEPGDWLVVTGHDRLRRFLAIRTGATTGGLDCTYGP